MVGHHFYTTLHLHLRVQFLLKKKLQYFNARTASLVIKIDVGRQDTTIILLQPHGILKSFHLVLEVNPQPIDEVNHNSSKQTIRPKNLPLDAVIS